MSFLAQALVMAVLASASGQCLPAETPATAWANGQLAQTGINYVSLTGLTTGTEYNYRAWIFGSPQEFVKTFGLCDRFGCCDRVETVERGGTIRDFPAGGRGEAQVGRVKREMARGGRGFRSKRDGHSLVRGGLRRTSEICTYDAALVLELL